MGRVIFLGTGDPLNEERAQTSLAVPLSGGETMLFDASSGTVLLRQLRGAGIALTSVRHLFFTHRHFDHAGGLAPLLIALTALPETSLTIHAPPETLRALHGLLALTTPGVENWLGGRLRWSELAPERPARAGDAEVTPFEVDHGIECVGFRVARGGSTLVYAADTRPCPSVVRYAEGADLLIHEAYGREQDAKRAHTFGHSTAPRLAGTPAKPGLSASYSPTCARAASSTPARSQRRLPRSSVARSRWQGTSTLSTSEPQERQAAVRPQPQIGTLLKEGPFSKVGLFRAAT